MASGLEQVIAVLRRFRRRERHPRRHRRRAMGNRLLPFRFEGCCSNLRQNVHTLLVRDRAKGPKVTCARDTSSPLSVLLASRFVPRRPTPFAWASFGRCVPPSSPDSQSWLINRDIRGEKVVINHTSRPLLERDSGRGHSGTTATACEHDTA